ETVAGHDGLVDLRRDAGAGAGLAEDRGALDQAEVAVCAAGRAGRGIRTIAGGLLLHGALRGGLLAVRLVAGLLIALRIVALFVRRRLIGGRRVRGRFA